jgi:hypothetical protein
VVFAPPSPLGVVWLILACFGYEAISVTGFLFPDYADIGAKLAGPALTAELAIMLWLVIMGAKENSSPTELRAASQLG